MSLTSIFRLAFRGPFDVPAEIQFFDYSLYRFLVELSHATPGTRLKCLFILYLGSCRVKWRRFLEKWSVTFF